jgi:hypothetical protein
MEMSRCVSKPSFRAKLLTQGLVLLHRHVKRRSERFKLSYVARNIPETEVDLTSHDGGAAGDWVGDRVTLAASLKLTHARKGRPDIGQRWVQVCV